MTTQLPEAQPLSLRYFSDLHCHELRLDFRDVEFFVQPRRQADGNHQLVRNSVVTQNFSRRKLVIRRTVFRSGRRIRI